MELTPLLSNNKNKSPLSNVSVNDECKNIQSSSNELEVNLVTKVNDQIVQRVLDSGSSTGRKTIEETNLNTDHSVSDCSIVNNKTDLSNNDSTNQDDIISLTKMNKQDEAGNMEDEQNDQGECSNVHKAYKCSDSSCLPMKINQLDNKTLDDNFEDDEFLNRSAIDKGMDSLDQNNMKRHDSQLTTSTPNSKLSDEAAVTNEEHSTNVGDDMEGNSVQPTVDMSVVDAEEDIEGNLTGETSTISIPQARRNELLYHVMQQSTRDAELSHRERAATRIQKFLRLNRSKFNSSEECYDRDVNPVFMPTKYSVFKGHRNARTMVSI